MIERLRRSNGDYCKEYLVGMETTSRLALFNRLVYDRLERKCNEIKHVYDTTGENWNQAFYIQLLKYIGSPTNREVFVELARRATYPMVLKERRSLQRVEALLFGAAGLLEGMREDEYVRTLKRDFEYLRTKHGVKPLDRRDWRLSGMRDANRPVARLAQAAVLFTNREFLFDEVVECRNRKNVNDLLGVQSSEYWIDKKSKAKSIGQEKTDMLAVNVVAILQFTYGVYTQREELRERAITLLEKIPAEANKPVARWTTPDFKPQSAFDTQALKQLADTCLKKACDSCPIAHRLSEKVSK